MDLDFTNHQKQMRKQVIDFAEREIKPFIPRMEQGEFPREILRKMGSFGLMGIPVPQKYGGMERDFISYIVTIHELSKVSATVGVILSVHTSVGTNPILLFGSEEQKQRYVPKLASGQYLGAFCLTEASAGSDAANLKTKAIRMGDEYVINGSKLFITNGGEADIYIVFAVTDPAIGKKGITAFIVEKNTPGLIFGKDEQKMGLHGSRTRQLHFENMKIPVANRLGNEGDGFRMALANLEFGRIGIAAQALGIAEAAYEAAVAFSKSKQPSQGMAFRLADMAVNLDAAKLLVYRAADRKQRGLSCGKESSIAKLFASKTAVYMTSEAIQVLGEAGFTDEYPLERYFRDAKITEIYEGTSEIQRIVISKHL
ncbi:acyl-CoA dehydrogenase family protein [Bacillus tuaregi]|uniref:acyl-CoA dehydrogenase family protein n=1 Tax=Bacillus tuaregi TaxID=1816695 RepID=UPI0008F86415|nr:acyl-CoA dehydrogenase family protein [Bacillus tuaregi]